MAACSPFRISGSEVSDWTKARYIRYEEDAFYSSTVYTVLSVCLYIRGLYIPVHGNIVNLQTTANIFDIAHRLYIEKITGCLMMDE